MDSLTQIDPQGALNDKVYLRPEDILFPNRGSRVASFVFPENQPQTLVGSQFFIIRVKSQSVLPEYVAWYLRSSKAANHLQALRKQTLVQTVERGDLESLQIPVPSLEKQKIIVEIDKLETKARQIEKQLQQLHHQYLQGRLIKAASSQLP